MKSSTKSYLLVIAALAGFSSAAAEAALTTSTANGRLDVDGTWEGGSAPMSGADSVVVAHNINITSEFTIASGETLTATGGTLRIGDGGHLTVATGGSLDLGDFNMAESGAGGHLTIEADATAKVNKLWNDEDDPSYVSEWIANASGVTTLEVADRFTLRGTSSVLSVDLSNYDLSNGTTLVLVDYGELFLQSQAAGDNGWSSVILSEGWTADLDLTHDIDGEGDLGIALTNISGTGDIVAIAITEISYVPDADPNPTVTLTWRTTGSALYAAYLSRDLSNWSEDLDDNITPDRDEDPGDPDHITMTFPLTFDRADAVEMFFRIEEKDAE